MTHLIALFSILILSMLGPLSSIVSSALHELIVKIVVSNLMGIDKSLSGNTLTLCCWSLLGSMFIASRYDALTVIRDAQEPDIAAMFLLASK